MTARKRPPADIIPTENVVRPTEAGYYWARLVVWRPPAHLPQDRGFPALSDPCIVRVMFCAVGKPHVMAGRERRERFSDWLFLERVPDICPIERPGRLLPAYEYLLEGPKAP